MKRVLISLYDRTGNWSRPYREAGWHVVQVDIQFAGFMNFYNEDIHADVMDFDYKKYTGCKVGLLIAQPCTCYALSGARHFAAKDAAGITAKSNLLVNRSKEIKEYFEKRGDLVFWALENPMSRIHKINKWLGMPALKFHPCDYAGYDPNPDKSRYNKSTWLWGRFNEPEKKYMTPLSKNSPVWEKHGGSSIETKNARSITPLGFAYAFYSANN